MTFDIAVEKCSFDVIQWLYDNHCPWDQRTCARAAFAGRFEILKWLLEKGCPWGRKVCSAAAEGGHLHILQWLHQRGCPIHAGMCEWLASENEHTKTQNWLDETFNLEDYDHNINYYDPKDEDRETGFD